MSPELVGVMIPIVAILAIFGFPVARRWFKLKERELEVDSEIRRTSGALEQRVQRLESIILALDVDLRAKLAALEPPAQQLLEGPASAQNEQPALRSGASAKLG